MELTKLLLLHSHISRRNGIDCFFKKAFILEKVWYILYLILYEE